MSAATISSSSSFCHWIRLRLARVPHFHQKNIFHKIIIIMISITETMSQTAIGCDATTSTNHRWLFRFDATLDALHRARECMMFPLMTQFFFFFLCACKRRRLQQFRLIKNSRYLSWWNTMNMCFDFNMLRMHEQRHGTRPFGRRQFNNNTYVV